MWYLCLSISHASGLLYLKGGHRLFNVQNNFCGCFVGWDGYWLACKKHFLWGSFSLGASQRGVSRESILEEDFPRWVILFRALFLRVYSSVLAVWPSKRRYLRHQIMLASLKTSRSHVPHQLCVKATTTKKQQQQQTNNKQKTNKQTNNPGELTTYLEISEQHQWHQHRQSQSMDRSLRQSQAVSTWPQLYLIRVPSLSYSAG